MGKFHQLCNRVCETQGKVIRYVVIENCLLVWQQAVLKILTRQAAFPLALSFKILC